MKIARDSKGTIVWVYGRKDLSILSYKEVMEGVNMESGTITHIPTKKIFYPPLTITKEVEK